jgi:U3 small nucleolar RNA-associated protein 21
LAVDNDNVYATAGSILYQYARGKVVASYDVASVASPNATSTSSSTSTSITLNAITLFGTYACVLEVTGKALYVFSLSKNNGPSLHSTIEFADHFTATNVLHPATYLNKVLVSSKEGHLQLWNIATHTLIHEFEAGSILPLHYSGAITCIVQSPAIDVVALGYATGSIALFDIRVGELLLHLTTTTSNPTQKNPITALSFRTDNVAQTLASSDAEGNLAFWDLDKGGVLASVTRKAHERSIHGLVFIPGQPVLVSAGSDNAIRVSF